MCPACISTLALIAVGTGTGGGLSALLVKTLRGRSTKNLGRAARADAPATAAQKEIHDEERDESRNDPRAAQGGLEE